MKAIRLFWAVIITFSLCFATVPATVFAVSESSKTVTEKAPKKVAEKATKKKTSKKKAVSKAAPKSININTADKATLSLLPGIGPAKADAILKHRKANGKFKSISELTQVKGIGDKTLKKLQPFLVKL